MIFGNINNLEKNSTYPDIINEVLDYIKDTDWSKKENATYELKGKKLYFTLKESETVPEEGKKGEVHRKYVDLQYIVSGEELMKVAIDSGKNKILSEYSEERDVLFYESVPDESRLAMPSGSFAVFFPNDIHTPDCIYKEKKLVRKAVFKIDLDLF